MSQYFSAGEQTVWNPPGVLDGEKPGANDARVESTCRAAPGTIDHDRK
jgi:hypothetical protein